MRPFARVPRLSLLLVLLAVAAIAVPAVAGQRIEFKNGQVLVVQRVRYEGDVAYLTLADGSEIGFPRALIKQSKTGFQVRHRPFETHYAGRGPSVSQLRGYKRLLGEAGYPAKVVAKGVLSGKHKKKISVGFRYRGSIDITATAQGTGEAVPVWDAARVAGGGQVTPANPGAAPTNRPARREPATSVAAPRQILPPKKGLDGFVRDPRKRWD